QNPPPSGLYTLSLHDALPILGPAGRLRIAFKVSCGVPGRTAHHTRKSVVGTLAGAKTQLEMDQYGVLPAQRARQPGVPDCYNSRSEEHTSELQSLRQLVCRLL